MTLDLTLDSLSNTAMETIHETTRVIRAIKVILLMIAAWPRRKKQAIAAMRTVMMYLSQPPRLKITGISRAAQMTPSSRHFKIRMRIASIKKPLSFRIFSEKMIYNLVFLFFARFQILDDIIHIICVGNAGIYLFKIEQRLFCNSFVASVLFVQRFILFVSHNLRNQVS